jgi:hypothetical protein
VLVTRGFSQDGRPEYPGARTSSMLVNPYIAGNPVGAGPAFVGRDDILKAVLRFFEDPQRQGVVLYGQRRVGKTSILQQLEAWLPRNGGPRGIYFDLQDKAGWPVGRILADLAVAVAAALKLPKPSPGSDPEAWFRDTWLPPVLDRLPAGQSLVVLFDEFDVLADPKSQREAREALRPPGERSFVELGVTWSRARPAPVLERPKVRFSEGVFGLLSGAGQALRDRSPTPGLEVEGFVVRLARGAEVEETGEAVIAAELLDRPGASMVHVDLERSDYAAAIDAHKLGLRVRVSGTLNVERRTLRIVKHAGLEVLGRDPMEGEGLEVAES